MKRNEREVKTREMSCPMDAREKLLITTYQEVNDLFRSNTRCDDENVRDGGNTDLPEQHFSLIRKITKNDTSTDIHRSCLSTYSIIMRIAMPLIKKRSTMMFSLDVRQTFPYDRCLLIVTAFLI